MWAFRAFFYPWFHFSFQYFRSFDLKKVTKRCLNTLTLNLRYMWAWSFLICLGSIGRLMWKNVCQEVGTQSIEIIKLKFSFVSFSGWLSWDWCNLFNNWTHLVKSFLISFLQSISVFPCCIFPFSFSESNLSLEERNETLKTPNYILKQRRFWKFSLLQSTSERISQNVDIVHKFFVKIVTKSSWTEFRLYQLQLYSWEWRLFDKLICFF